MNILCDTPLSNISKDKFKRGPIVNMIVDSVSNMVMTDHVCMVYGIYGKWGEGKSSLMNFIKEGLLNKGKDDKINIVEFNPWLVNNEEALLRELYKNMVSDAKNELTEALEQYSSMAIFASKTIINAFVPGIGGALAEGITLAKDAFVDCKDSLAELKKKVSPSLIREGDTKSS